jgi:PAS domain S-box-containing protein
MRQFLKDSLASRWHIDSALTLDSEDRVVTRLHTVSRFCTYCVVVYAGVALFGWFMDIPTLTSVQPGLATTSFLTAICLLLSALTIHKLTDHVPGWHSHDWFWLGSILIVLLASVYALFCYISGFAAVYHLLGRDIGSLSPATAACLILIDMAVFLTDIGNGRISACLSALGLLIAELDIVGHVYGAEALYKIKAFSTMAVTTALAFVVLFAALLLVRPRQGWIQYAVRSDRVGTTFRFLMPTIITTPFVFGYLSVRGTDYGLFDRHFAFAILAVATSVVLGGLVCFAAAWLVNADSALRVAEDELRKNAQLLETGMGLAQLGAWQSDTLSPLAEETHVELSTEAYLIFGITKSHFDNCLSTLFKNVHINDKPAVAETYRTVLEQYAPVRIAFRIVRPDGTLRWVQQQSHVLRDMNGTATRMIGVIQDVTEARLVEQQLVQTQKMEAIGNLTGGMAHDFNNLLGVIIGNLDILQPRLAQHPETAQLVEEALSAALRGSDLTRSLLAFARRQPLMPQPVRPNELITSVAKLLNRTLGEAIEISLALSPGVLPVIADPAQLEASIINLANNARDAMPNGGVLTIATSNKNLDQDYADLHPEVVLGSYSLIEVSDTGSGIPPEMLNHIFEPFFTTKEQGKGTGLGLSMVFGFVKQSAGHITVYSEIGHGTTFRLYLPRATSDANIATEQIASLQSGHEAILAVEDNEGLRQVVVRQLNDLGYRVFEARDGIAALKVLETEPIDLLFTDIIMPGGMSGYELAQNAMTRQPSLKVLLTSGFTETNLNGNGGLLPKMQLLTKPYRKADLARALRKALEAE